MKPALVALALTSAFSLACAGPLPRPAAADDPANPQAPEAPAPRPSDTLTSDPPPARDGGRSMPASQHGAPAADGGQP